ncbi:MAG TPA: hypothetical protein VFR95_01410 [Gemmatimonadaceae bacterium]|nr:hypothetical protein [Gemmatimonadaceae bacterium]
MPGSFTYDVALSYVAEDALTARQLISRLQPRLHTLIFDCAAVQRGEPHAIPVALTADSRIVVVLQQRLWGETLSTQRDLSAIQERLDRQGSAFLLVVALESSVGTTGWMPANVSPTPLSSDCTAEVDAIIDAILRAGGQVMPRAIGAAGSAPVSNTHDNEIDDGYLGGRGALLSSHKVATVAQREVALLIDGVEKGVDEIRAAFRDVKVEVRRAPGRCVLQAGKVGLSLSWLHRPMTSAEGALLVMEWDGAVTFPGERARRHAQASVARELLLHLETAAWPAWNWSEDDVPTRKYSSADLASLCVQLVMRRLRYAESVIGTSAPALLM